MISFEDGTLVSDGYVEIDGVKYPIHLPEYSGTTPISAENLNKLQKDIKVDTLETVFPVGSRYITESADTNPNTILGFGTWERFKGKVALGVDEDDTDFSTVGNTGGEKTHLITYKELPNETMYNELKSNKGKYLYISTATTGLGWSTNTEGDCAQPHNNLQPYEVVGYVWIRRS